MNHLVPVYNFSASIDALENGNSSLSPIRDLVSLEPVDNTLLAVGASSGTLYQRVPVPIGMWRPFTNVSVPLRLNGPGVIGIDHQRVAVLICYEEMLTFPVLASILRHPTVMVGISNSFWFDDTTIPRYQATSMISWARLFGLPLFMAVNS